MWDIRQVRRQASLAAQQQRKNLEQKKWLEEKAVKTVEVGGSWLGGWGDEDDWHFFLGATKINAQLSNNRVLHKTPDKRLLLL